MLFLRPLILIAMCVQLSACVSTVAGGAQFKKHRAISKSEALIYLYRPIEDTIAMCFKIYINNEKMGCLKPLGFVKFNVVPGVNSIMADLSSVTLKFSNKFQGGTVYYYRYSVLDKNSDLSDAVAFQKAAVYKNTVHGLVEVPEKKALSNLANLRKSIE